MTGTERVQQGDLTFAGETDAVFRTSDPVTLHDPALGRRLVVTTEGAADVVVWNPWAAKAAEVPDIGDDDWRALRLHRGRQRLRERGGARTR